MDVVIEDTVSMVADETIVSRVKELMKAKGFHSENSFSTYIGIAQASVNYMLNKNKKISVDVLCIILNRFPDVSAEWLMRGEGCMQKCYIDRNEVIPCGNVDVYERRIDTLLEIIRNLSKMDHGR